MMFKFDFEKCSETGLVLKRGSNDRVVFFFDENEDAAYYRLQLFRTEIKRDSGSFNIPKALIKKNVITKYDDNTKTEKIEYEELENTYGDLFFTTNELVYRSEGKIGDCLFEINGVKKDYRHNTQKYIYSTISKVPFDDIKYITTIENDRNKLYFNIDFLPFGQYVALLQMEDRSGNVIKMSFPFYFKIEQRIDDSTKEIIEAINKASDTNLVNW